MLWRLNFLVLSIMLMMGTNYILYYIVPLHTFYFLMVLTTMGVYRSINYTSWYVDMLQIFVFLDAIRSFLIVCAENCAIGDLASKSLFAHALFIVFGNLSNVSTVFSILSLHRFNQLWENLMDHW